MVASDGDTGTRGSARPRIDADRNLVALGERLGWPPGAAGNCQAVEARFPGWYCWWTPDPWPDPGFRPAYGAARTDRATAEPSIYGRAPGVLVERIRAEITRRAGKAAARDA